MTKRRRATIIHQRSSKYTQCPKCRLNIRCGDVTKHEAGYHHKTRKVEA